MFLKKNKTKHDDPDNWAENGLVHFEKFGETLTPNMRALRMTMTISDVLLSMGVAANSVVSKALDITDVYCKSPVHIDVSANVLMLSQLRGIEKEPLTLIRPVATRNVNYMTIQSVQSLIHKIREGKLSLRKAEAELEQILANPIAYPWWVVMVGNAGIAAGISLMFTYSWRVVLVTFAVGLMVDRLLAFFAKRAMPLFFRQIAAAAFVTIAAAVISQLGRNGVHFFADMNPTLIVVGGIIMLLAGLLIVGAIQDAIEEYYVTASARILKVMMLTVGIVIGTTIGLYAARKFGLDITVSPDPLRLSAVHLQLLGAGIASGAYALSTQTPFRAIGWAGLVGVIALVASYYAGEFGVADIAARGIAAAAVGMIALIIARIWHTPSAGIIAAGIIPLAPGLAMYNGLAQFVNYPPGDANFTRGLGTLFTAVAIALAVGAGATFGSMVARPLRQKLARQRNISPFTGFMSRQLGLGRKSVPTFKGIGQTLFRTRRKKNL